MLKFRVTVLHVFLFVFVPYGTSRNLDFSDEDLREYTSGQPVDDYDITSPEFIESEPIGISKRSADSNPPRKDDREVKLNAFGETHHIKLRRNYWLLRPGLQVERVAADGTVTIEDIPGRDCHYFGYMISYENESAGALSTCNGLRGVITHNNTDYFIAPLKKHHTDRVRRESVSDRSASDRSASGTPPWADSGDGGLIWPHVIYKRTSSRSLKRTRRNNPTSPPSTTGAVDDERREAGYNNTSLSNNASDYEGDADVENDITGNDTASFCTIAYPPSHGRHLHDSPMDEFSAYDNLHESVQNTHNDNPYFWNQNVTSWLQSAVEGDVDRRPVSADMMASQEVVPRTQEDGTRYIEYFLIIDSDMVWKHEDDAVNYSLGLMNIASRRYAESSLGSQVRLAIVRIVVAESSTLSMVAPDGETYSFKMTSSGTKLIDDLCNWQKHFNPPSDSDPTHWDLASIITRMNLYRIVKGQEDYNLLGRAFMGAICHLPKSCQIIEDYGLEAGFIIAHETGHSLNLLHDPDYACTDGRNIMSSRLTTGVQSFQWSECSAANLAKFLKSPRSRCLLDRPFTDHPDVDILPIDQLPGTQYSRLKQCRLRLGSRIHGLCRLRSRYTCTLIGCTTFGLLCTYVAVMEGTPCGRDKWCLSGFCVSSIGGIPPPIDGGWSDYDGNFTSCSRTCGKGVRQKRRYCNNPTPWYGGEACQGPASYMEICNTDPCPGETQNADKYRQEECAANRRPYEGEVFDWKANIDSREFGDKLCQLTCVPVTSSSTSGRIVRGTVSDGTQCWGNEEPDELQRRRYCVMGRCEEFGCDGRYHSGQTFDVCGKCEGSGRTCTYVNGTSTNSILSKWVRVAKIPVNSTSVKIQLASNRINQLGLQAGGRRVFWPGYARNAKRQRYRSGDMIILFDLIHNSWSKIKVVTGPTSEEIIVSVRQLASEARYGSRAIPVVNYEWYQPIDKHVTYYWEQTPTSNAQCTMTCGGGDFAVPTFCIEDIEGETAVVSTCFCDVTTKPASILACNTQPCPGSNWLRGEWGECSVTCGSGTRQRTVECIYGDTLVPLPDSLCIEEVEEKPSTVEECYGTASAPYVASSAEQNSVDATMAQATIGKASTVGSNSETTTAQATIDQVTTSESTTAEPTTPEASLVQSNSEATTAQATTAEPTTPEVSTATDATSTSSTITPPDHTTTDSRTTVMAPSADFTPFTDFSRSADSTSSSTECFINLIMIIVYYSMTS